MTEYDPVQPAGNRIVGAPRVPATTGALINVLEVVVKSVPYGLLVPLILAVAVPTKPTILLLLIDVIPGLRSSIS